MTANRPQPSLTDRLRCGDLARRGVLRALFTAAVAALTGGALARVAAAPPDGGARALDGPFAREAGTRTPEGGSHARGGHGPAPGGAAHARVEGAFDEMYQGRRIQGRPVEASSAGGFEVLVDGRELHLMRCADGGYLTLVNHYEAYPTPLAATRAAVDELGGARLAAHGVEHGSAVRREGGHRGVHA
ncbi:tyrosinase family oxidase copper chaperone [Streptomyces sp. enrichment culture]|uniref:tyrosinase family oxidase copper chaperone n=1 Tax=Streptomyces sp. enrichment culture TaxID=1795815 RepID=UPI003F551EC5